MIFTLAERCPIQAIVPYLIIRATQPGPLFVFSDGSYLTRQRFTSSITSTLQRAGINDKQYNTHSFRIGAVTTAKEAGVSDVEIKMLGRWKSSAYQLYVHTPRDKLAKLSEQMKRHRTKELNEAMLVVVIYAWKERLHLSVASHFEGSSWASK